MRILDPGHRYELDALDGDAVQILQFVKREGEKYPGNIGSCSGTTTQEVLRACIHRLIYVDSQIPCAETQSAAALLEAAILLLELRAARRHNRHLDLPLDAVVFGKKCSTCGHVGCKGHR